MYGIRRVVATPHEHDADFGKRRRVPVRRAGHGLPDTTSEAHDLARQLGALSALRGEDPRRGVFGLVDERWADRRQERAERRRLDLVGRGPRMNAVRGLRDLGVELV